MSQYTYTDEALAPFHNVLLAQGDRNLLMIDAFENSARG